MKILVLDDLDSRLKIFKENIEQKLNAINSTDYAKTADEAIEFLKKNLDYDYIFLDRDLGDNVPSGEDVVSYIINNNYPKENVGIIVHSWNIPAGKKNVFRIRSCRISLHISTRSMVDIGLINIF